jgi:hypothetical protein
MRKLAVTALALVPFIAACGGDDEADTTTPPAESSTTLASSAPAPSSTEAADTSAAPESSAPASTSADSAPADTASAGGSGPVAIELDEWTLTSGPVAAGPVDFAITNVGEFPHEFVVIKGDSYATLPQTPAGAVDEAQLPADAVIGEAEDIAPGASASLSVELEPGNYVFICNIAVGPNSHAKQGQVLDVTVA